MSQTLTEIKQLLAAYGLRPRHKLGQNFLHDGNQMRRIMDAADLRPRDVVLEVGPGTGALTERLLEAGAVVVANEIDTDLEPLLRERFAQALAAGRLTLVMGDVLENKRTVNAEVMAAVAVAVAAGAGGGAGKKKGEADTRRFARQASLSVGFSEGDGGRSFKLIANLPYSIASPLLANLVADHRLEGGGSMTDAVVMIQKEVAERLTAGPGGKDYGPLGILIQAMCKVQIVGTLSPGCFWPPPKVESAIVHLRRRDKPLTDDPAALSTLLQTLFTKRRKQLGSILGRDTPLPAGISPDARPESLTLQQLIQLTSLN